MNLLPQEIEAGIQKLYQQIAHQNIYTHIVGIANGGLHISQPLSKMLNLPHFQVKISYYGPKVIINSCGYEWKRGCLLVDDLIDSGKTIKTFREMFGPADTAVLLCDKNHTATFTAWKKPDEWVTFPWET